MPRKKGLITKGEFIALQVIKLGKPVTPKEINDHVGIGDYAAKYISFLRNRHGFNITVQKDGRKVTTYTLVAEPDNAAEIRAKANAPSKSKPVKAKPAKSVSNAESRRQKAAQEPVELEDEVTSTFGSSGAARSYSVDPDWDAVDSVADLIR